MADWLATLVPVLGRALLHFVWQGALIGLLAAIAMQSLRNARPQVRYAVACLAMLACVLVPVVHVLMQLVGSAQATTATVIAPVAHAIDAATMPPVDVATWPLRFGELLPQDALPLIVALWAAGASVLSLRMAMGVMWIQRLRATPQGPAHAAWQARLDALAQRFGPMRHVALRLVDALDSPASAGWWRPVVLLPTALIARMPVDLIEALLAHELAHVRRHDYLVNLLQGVVEAVLFYHPVTWWLSRRIRIEREHVADRLAADATGEPRRLALALSLLSEPGYAGTAPPHLAQAARAAHGGHLMSRIQQLVQPGRRAAGGRVVFPLLGLVAACVALYAHAQVVEPKAAPAAATPVVAASPATAATPAVAAVPVPAVTSGPVLRPHAAVAQVSRIDADRTDDAYALVRKGRDGFSMSGSSDDIPAIEAARAQIDGDFLWFRRDDKAYVVVDPATVSRVAEAWREVDELGVRMRSLGDRMEMHGAKLEALGTQMEQLSTQHRPSPAMDAASARMEELAEQQEQLASRQMRVAEQMAQAGERKRDALHAQMDTLASQMDAVSEQMDQQSKVLEAEGRRLEASQAPMEALSHRMEEASKPMEALSEQMEALSAQQQEHVEVAMRETRMLFDSALKQGLAKPAPGPARRQ